MGAISWGSIYGSLGSSWGAWSFSIIIALGVAWRFGAFWFYNPVFTIVSVLEGNHLVCWNQFYITYFLYKQKTSLQTQLSLQLPPKILLEIGTPGVGLVSESRLVISFKQEIVMKQPPIAYNPSRWKNSALSIKTCHTPCQPVNGHVYGKG